MRAVSTPLAAAAIAVASLLVFPAPAGKASATGRATSDIQAPNLPARITIETGKGRLEIERDGAIRKIGPRILPFPHDAAWRPGTGIWFAIRHRHLVIGRWGRTLWRSTGRYTVAFNVGGIAIGDGTMAFSYRTRGGEQLYVAALHGRERPVARDESPLGWTSGGFLVYRYPGRQLLLRSATGAFEQTIARHPVSYYYEDATQSLYFIANGDLMRTYRGATRPIASLRRLGLSPRKPDAELVPLGRLVELLTNQRLILLNPDGTTFAETRLRYPDGALAGDVALAPHGDAVAFASPQTVASKTASELDTVYVLRAGAHAATPVHTERVNLTGCVQWTAVDWHGRWLLYSASDGHLAVIDSHGREPAIELTAVLHRLIKTANNGFGAYWSDAPPAL